MTPFPAKAAGVVRGHAFGRRDAGKMCPPSVLCTHENVGPIERAITKRDYTRKARRARARELRQQIGQ
jgi:hypothetical protein